MYCTLKMRRASGFCWLISTLRCHPAATSDDNFYEMLEHGKKIKKPYSMKDALIKLKKESNTLKDIIDSNAGIFNKIVDWMETQ